MIASGKPRVSASEDLLAARCRAGDPDAFGEAYALYERQVFRCAYHLLGHREDADDIKQETFVRAFQSIGKFRGDSSLQTWLLKICANLCRDRIKSWERRSVSYDAGASGEDTQDARLSADPCALAEQSQMAEIVFQALRGMPAAQREVIVLHDIEDLNYQEMSVVLGCSAVSCKLRVFRARRSLKERVLALQK